MAATYSRPRGESATLFAETIDGLANLQAETNELLGAIHSKGRTLRGTSRRKRRSLNCTVQRKGAIKTLERGALSATQDLFNATRVTFEVLEDESPVATPRLVSKGIELDDVEKPELQPAQFAHDPLEKHPKELAFSTEALRVSEGADMFVPAPDVTLAQLQAEKQRLDAIEKAKRLQQASLEEQVEQLKLFKEHDKAAQVIQKVARGRLGRRKAQLQRKIRGVANQSSQDWIEIYDRKTTDKWYYNKRTGASQWEKPPELKDHVASPDKFRALPGSTTRLAESGLQMTAMPEGTGSSHDMASTGTTDVPSRPGTLSRSLTAYSEQEMELNFEIEDKASSQGTWRQTIEMDEQLEQFMSTGGLFGPDGGAKPLLRDTVRNALRISKFDSVSSLLSYKPLQLTGASTSSSARSVQLLEPIEAARESAFRELHGRKKMAAVLKLPQSLAGSALSPAGSPSRQRLRDKQQSMLSRPSIQHTSDIEGVTLRQVTAPGFEDPVERQDSSPGTPLLPAEGQAGGEHTLEAEHVPGAKSNARQKICFGCWSSGRRGCKAHQDNSPIDAAESMVLCRNWDFSVMYRKYRSEEIQEVFEKQAAALRYDSKRKRFLTLVECRHVIYRQVYECIRAINFTFRCRDRTKRWMVSFAEQIKAGHARAQRTQTKAKAMRHRHTLAHLSVVEMYTRSIEHLLPLSPVTGCSWEEKNGLVQLLVEHRDQSTGQTVRCIVATPIPEPVQLYMPRQYLPAAPMPIPMPTTKSNLDTHFSPPPLSNQFISDTNPAAWLERFSAGAVHNALYNALEKVCAITPTNPVEETFKSKYPPPRTVRFATLCRKAALNDKAVGGLSALLLVHQLVTTHVPVQFGGFLLIDRTTISPLRHPDVSITFESLRVHPANQLYVYRPVQHALNNRRPPTITVREGITDVDHLYYGNNRPEQTGEQEYRGFRTSAWCITFKCDDATHPAVFVPHSEIATLNKPAVNDSMTTRVDLDYPFCEPSSRDNTTLDFYHLLLLGTCSPNKPQVFTVMTTQEPGDFMRGSDRTKPLGHFVAAVYRSWAFTQSDPVEKFYTDDGIPYWYSKRTGQTYWEKPLAEEESRPVKEGGTRLLENLDEPPSYMQRGRGGLQTIYTQGEVRSFITKHHEDVQAVRARRRNAQKTLASALQHGTITPEMYMTDNAATDLQLESNSSSGSSNMQHHDKQYNGLPIGRPYADDSVMYSNVLDHSEEIAQQQAAKDQAQQGWSAIEIAHGISEVEITPTPDDLYHQAQEAAQRTLDDGLTVDERLRKELPLVAFPGVDLSAGHGFRSHDLAGKGTTFVPHEEANLTGYVKGSKKPLRHLEAPLPTGFFDAIMSTHVARRNVDYLAQVPNLPRPRHVGRVKPRSSAVDWLAVGFDPWSAGKPPLNVEFIDSLIGKQDELMPASAHITAGVPAPTIDLEDITGLEEQQAHISKAAKMAEDFKIVSSLARHNKVNEIEQLMSQDDWNLPIDYQDATGNTLLHVAVQNGNKRIAKLCLRLGADINAQNFNGQTPLHYAYKYNSVELGEYLISKGANDAIRNSQGLTCYEGLSMEDVEEL